MRCEFILLLSLTLLLSINGHAQCPTASFSSPANVCRNEQIRLVNTSDDGDYRWDFCAGEIANTPAANPDFTAVNAIGRPGLEFVKHDNQWYGFLTGTWSSTLYRLHYENGLDESPTVIENLGNLNGLLDNPGQIRVFEESGQWFGIVLNALSGNLLKLTFGSSPANPVVAEVLATGLGTLNAGVAMGKDPVHGWICVTSNVSNQFVIVRLGQTIESPEPADILVSGSVPNQNNLGDVDLVKECDQWYGFANNLGNGNVYRLKFGTNLFQVPAIDELANLGGINGGRIRIIHDATNYYLLAAALDGSMFRVELGTDLDVVSPTFTNLGTFGGVLQNSYGVGVAKDNSYWNVSVVDASAGKVNRLVFPANCDVTISDDDPLRPVISYGQAGTYTISLQVEDEGKSDVASAQVVVGALVAPDISISSENVCANHDVTFTSSNNSGGIDTHQWDFGDTGGAGVAAPVHQYANPGTYNVMLEVLSSNGCRNTDAMNVKIYENPQASFTLPSGLICTNNEFVFTNTTPDNFDGLLQSQWLVNGDPEATTRDLGFAFNDVGDFQIRLEVSIPGCDDAVQQDVTGVQSGPLVNFSVEGQCEDTALQLNSDIDGSITSLQWDFGNGTSSTIDDPTVTYSNPGTYTILLDAEAPNGCVTSVVRDHQVFMMPQPAFTMDLPPFSCAGTPTQFHDITPAPADSNLQEWNWNFGNGSGTGRHPVFQFMNPGDAEVAMEVVTDKGCRASALQTVTIAPSPSPMLTVGTTCVNQPTTFVTNDTDVDTWQWKINNTNYNISNPVHVFVSPGSYNVQLTKTGTNDCVTTINQQVVVPVVPDINFSVANPCAGQETTFTQDVQSGSDPAVSYSWIFPGNVMSAGGVAAQTFQGAGTFPVTLRAVTSSGCTYSHLRNISIFETPVAIFTATPSNGTPPLLVQFMNQSQGAVSYNWNFNDESNGTSTAVQPTYSFNALGEYVVDLTATSAQGCSDMFSGSVNVIVPFTELELVSFDLVKDENSGAWQSLITVKNNSNYPLAAFNAILDLGAGTRLSEKISVAIPPGSTENIVLSNQLISTQISGYACVELQMAGDELLSNNTRCQPLGGAATIFSPYPNPAKDYINLRVVAAAQSPVEIFVVNSLGANVYDKVVAASPGLNVFTIDLTFFDTGIYFVMIRCGNARSTSRIVVE